MTDPKYNMLTLQTHNEDKKIRNQPWWKERLRTKYIKSLGPDDTSKFLQGKNWTFIKDGLDDFRDGLPPPVEDGIMIKGQKGLGPNLQGSSATEKQVKQPVAKHRFNKHEICFSRVTPQQQQNRDYIDDIEYGLVQHPLALYPHLEECLPPDMFEDIVDILDPEMNVVDENDSLIAEEDEYVQECEDTVPEMPTSAQRRVHSTASTQEGEETKIKNPYRWLPRKEEKDKKDKKKAAEVRNSSPSQDEHINKVTKDFCNWVSDLGGESNNIEESTITSLFASGYETKPALSVPIHVVELTNVPPELRMSATLPMSQHTQQNLPSETQKEKQWVPSGTYEPSWVKFKYGVWYLDPKTWKKREADKPLEDPEELKKQEMSETKKKSNNLDSELAAIHGSKAFIEYIDKKGSRRPAFLDRVSDLQEELEREEQRRQQEEMEKKRRLVQRHKKMTHTTPI